MIGEVIQEYLVALGAKIDRPGFREMDQTIQRSGELINRATSGWAMNFVKASTIIASAVAGVSASVLGLMTAAAKQDLEFEKMSRQMMISREAAEQMKRATDALGESVQDITLNPELSERFRALSSDGSQMMIGGDFKETMKNFRDLIFEFTRLKQEASYAMTWIGYYLQKYLAKPLAEIKARFREFNDSFVKNISTWTEKAARGIVYILTIGQHFLQFLWDVGKALYNIWDSFPKGVKIATAALAGLWAIMKMSPLGRMITLVSALMLLIDDYYGYMEGKNAALGPLWDKLNEAIEYGKELWEEIVPVLEKVCDWAEETARAFMKWLDEMSRDEVVKDLIQAFKEMWKAIFDLGKEVWAFVRGALADLWEGFNKTDAAYSYRDALREVLLFVKELYKNIDISAKKLKNFFKVMKDSKIMSQFWKDQGTAAKRFLDLLVRAVGAAGKLGQALLLLTRGKWEDAKRLGGEAWDILMDNKNSRNSSHGGGGGSLDGGIFETPAGIYGAIGKAAAQYGASLIGNEEGNARSVYDDFKAAGYSDEAIAGIMGRVQQEHNFSTSNVEEHWAEGENGEMLWVGGYGMYQWNGGRTDAFLQFAAENGLDPQNPHTQNAYAIYEAYQRGLTPAYMNRLSAEDAATVWTDDWEVGVHGNEREYAQDWRNQIYAWNQQSYPYVAASSNDSPILEPMQDGGGWRDSIQAMQTAFASVGLYRTPPYMGGGSMSNNVTIGDVNITVEGGANASAEDIGYAVRNQLSSFLLTSRAQISPASI